MLTGLPGQQQLSTAWNSISTSLGAAITRTSQPEREFVGIAPHALDPYFELLTLPEHGKYIIWRYSPDDQLVKLDSVGTATTFGEFIGAMIAKPTAFAIYVWAKCICGDECPDPGDDRILYFDVTPNLFYSPDNADTMDRLQELRDLETVRGNTSRQRLLQASAVMCRQIKGVDTVIMPRILDFEQVEDRRLMLVGFWGRFLRFSMDGFWEWNFDTYAAEAPPGSFIALLRAERARNKLQTNSQ